MYSNSYNKILSNRERKTNNVRIDNYRGIHLTRIVGSNMDIFGDQVTMYVETCDLALFRSGTDRIL